MLWHERKIIMNILLINCSPVQNGATAEIIKIVNSFLEKGHNTKSICIDDVKAAGAAIKLQSVSRMMM